MARSHPRGQRRCGTQCGGKRASEARGGDRLSAAGRTMRMAGATVLRALLSLVFAAIVPSTAIAVDVQSFKLAKGEDVWFVSDHTLPMIALTAALPAGSSYDPAAKPGLASFAASLADEGAGKLNATAFQTALSNRAIRLSITPDR